MRPLNSFLDACRSAVRSVMRVIAKSLNSLSGGHLSPNAITITSLLAHIPIAYLIAIYHPVWAAILLVIFGLFDALDGELARLQNKASNAGMLLDASTDRFKEVILYVGIAYRLSYVAAAWAVAALGASLCVSYVKAKGETAVADNSLSANQINRLFQDGLLRYEVRMFLLVVGLLTNHLVGAIVLIGILASFTAIERLIKISRKLS